MLHHPADDPFEAALQCVLAARLEFENAREADDEEAFDAVRDALDLAVQRMYAVPRPAQEPRRR